MQKGDKVYVNFPTGRGGPYEVIFFHFDDSITVLAGGVFWNIAKGKYEPVKPELEEGRLYYRWDDSGRGKRTAERVPLYSEWDHIEPVHRRWNELSDEEQGNWFVAGNGISQYKYAYELITGEEHP